MPSVRAHNSSSTCILRNVVIPCASSSYPPVLHSLHGRHEVLSAFGGCDSPVCSPRSGNSIANRDTVLRGCHRYSSHKFDQSFSTDAPYIRSLLFDRGYPLRCANHQDHTQIRRRSYYRSCTIITDGEFGGGSDLSCLLPQQQVDRERLHLQRDRPLGHIRPICPRATVRSKSYLS